MNLKDITLSEKKKIIPKRLHAVWFHVCKVFEMTKFGNGGQISGWQQLGMGWMCGNAMEVFTPLIVVVDMQTYTHDKTTAVNMHTHMWVQVQLGKSYE